jgi:nephrocystin-3
VNTGAVLATAAVILANSEDMFIGDFPLPLWRGEAALARFTGLELVDPRMVSADRAVHIFISSTFTDFREERLAITQSVIPELNRRGLERDVAVTAVDLQWGVTSEETRQNQQLSACIREVDRCAPFFLALLGDRYGWVPPSPAFAGLERLERSQGLSITELEVRHAVLPGSTRNASALTYARGPYSDTIKQQKRLYDAISRCPTRAEQVRILETSRSRPTLRGAQAPYDNLIVDLINRGHDVRLLHRDYLQDITAQLWSLIETHFPPLDEFDARRREDRRHRHYGFAQSQFLDARWPTCQHIIHELSRGAVDTVVCQNSWESAAIAAMARQSATRNADRQVFEHYCGLDSELERTAELCGRLIEFMGRVSGRPTTIPAGAELRAKRLAEQIERMKGTPSAPITVVVAEGDLLDADGLGAIAALGRVAGIQVLLTMTQTSDSEPVIRWSPKELESFAVLQLKRSGRSLDASLINSIVTHSLSSNLCFVRFVCAFLDRWAVHETLGRELQRALSVRDWPDILEVVASRAREAGAATRSEIGRVLRHLKLSASGVELQKLVDAPGLGGRMVFEVRSLFPFLIEEWGARWRLSRGLAQSITLSKV